MGLQRIFDRLTGKANAKRRQEKPSALDPKGLISQYEKAKLPPLFFETLEPRLLLSATPFTFTANPLVAQDLTLTIVDAIGGPTVRLTNNATSAIIAERLVVDTSTISITLSNQTDRIIIAADFSKIGGGINGLAGIDRIFGAAKGAYSITGLDTGVALGLNFAAVEGLTGSNAISELFVLSTAGMMSAGIDGGAGSDVVRLTGLDSNVSLLVTSNTTATLSVTNAILRATNLTRVELISDLTSPTTRTATGSLFSEAITLSQVGTTTTARFSPTMAYSFVQNSGSVTIDEATGIGSITVTSNLTLPNSNLTLRAETITAGAFTVDTTGLTSQGSILFSAAGTGVGIGGTIGGFGASINTGTATIALNGSTLRSGAITLGAVTSLSSPATADKLALSGVEVNANVTLTGATLDATSGAVFIQAVTSATVSALANVQGGTTDATVDAAIAMGLARSTTQVTLDGSAISSTTGITVRSRNATSMTVTADGLALGRVGVGAVVAASFLESNTGIDVTGLGSMFTKGGIDLTAQSSSTVSTTAIGGTGGAEENAGKSTGEGVLSDFGARTSEGAIGVAAAVAVAKIDRVNDVTLAGAQNLDAANSTKIAALGTDVVNTLADATDTTGNVAAAVAIN